jgi:hypothetical protein
MDKICTHNHQLLEIISFNARCARNTDNHEFAYLLDTMAEDKRDKGSDQDANTVEYLTPCGLVKTEYLLQRDKEDETNSISPHAIDAMGHSDQNTCHINSSLQMPQSNSINSICDLVKAFQNILTNTGKCFENKWQFTYIDSSIGKLNLSVVKESQNQISVSISSLYLRENSIKKISQQLHSRLIHRGWVSQVKQVSEEEINNNQ